MINQVVKFLLEEWPFIIKRLTKKYYIIRRPDLGAGFFSNYYWVMGHIVFAKKYGYTPVVDMKNYKTLYSEDHPVDGVENAWNYYFDDVDTVTLEKAYESNKYVLGQEKYLSEYSSKYASKTYRFPTKEMIDYYHPIIDNHMKIKESIVNSFEEEWEKLAQDNLSIIGLHIRGTDMKNNLGHPMPADISRYKEALQKIYQELGNMKLYLATDEKSVVEQIEEFCKDKSISLKYQNAFRSDVQYNNHQTGIHEMKVEGERQNHKYLMGLEVLKDAYFLSKCDYLICGHSNITSIAVLWNNAKYKNIDLVES